MQIQKDGQTTGQIDEKTVRPIHKESDTQRSKMDRNTDRQTIRQTAICTHLQKESRTDGYLDRQGAIPSDGVTTKQRVKNTDKQDGQKYKLKGKQSERCID